MAEASVSPGEQASSSVLDLGIDVVPTLLQLVNVEILELVNGG